MGSGERRFYDRRTVLRAGLGAAAAAAIPLRIAGSAGLAGASTTRSLRPPGALPYPSLPVGAQTNAFPFDHLVIVMQENHSFDNYLGMLPQRGQPEADGFTFNKAGEPTNWNPVGNDRMDVYHQSGEVGSTDTGSQSWNDSHQQINDGAMNGFAATGPGSMGYYTEEDLPFYYSVANTFCLANRWFCSVPAQTYPNRRFLMSGTANGIISTDIENGTTDYPPHGTIWDMLSTYNISWTNYFSDAPTSIIMFDTMVKHPLNYASIAEFFVDADAGTLPAVSLVDCDMGAITGEIGGLIAPYPVPTFASISTVLDNTAQSEENPEDIQLGEQFVASVTHAVMSGPAWPRTLMIWLYDEHGGYYDHVAPPSAPAPDAVAPELAVGAVTNVVHDHTSVLATIEQQWNLPALTYRDANAASLIDFLDTSKMSFAEPPTLAAPANPAAGLLRSYQGQPTPPSPTP